MKVFCVADVHMKKRDERGCLQRESSAWLLPRLESKRASAIVGRCERCYGKNEWKLEFVQSGTNLELQLSCADQAHGMNIDTVWNILGPVRVDLNPGLKQSVASGFGDEADQEACKVSVPVLNLCQRARPPGPSKAILEFHLKL